MLSHRTNHSLTNILPVEINELILLRTLPPACLITHEMAYGRISFQYLATGQIKTIMAVCRLWYTLAKPLLYDAVDIRRPMQAHALLDSLKDSPDSSSLVRKLYVAVEVPDAWAQKYSRTLVSLVARLPALKSLSIHSPTSSPLPTGLSLPPLPPGLAALSLRFTSQLPTTWSLAALTALKLDIEWTPATFASDPPQDSSAEGLKLPALERLELLRAVEAAEPIVKTWTLPRLTRLTITLTSPPNAPADAIWSLVRAHGRRLKELQFFDTGYPVGLAAPAGASLAEMCPALVHLVVTNKCFFKYDHPNLRWVDSWGDVRGWSGREWMERRRAAYTRRGTPAAPLRLIDRYLAAFPSLPFDIPPSSLASEHDAFEFKFHDLHVRHEHGLLALVESPAYTYWWDDPEDPSDVSDEDEAVSRARSGEAVGDAWYEYAGLSSSSSDSDDLTDYEDEEEASDALEGYTSQ